MLENPYCLHKWADVENDIDMSNLTFLDKVLFATKEMTELGMNHYQGFGKPKKFLNAIFGYNPNATSEYHGVDNVWISGYDRSGLSARIPRIIVTLYDNSIFSKVEVHIGITSLPKDGKGTKHRFATYEEQKRVYEYLLHLIEERKAELKKAQESWSFEELKAKCLEYATDYLANCYPKFECKLTLGKSQVQTKEEYAIVINYKGYKDNTIFSQKGYVVLTENCFHEFYAESKALGCGGYSAKISEDNYKKVITDGIDFILN